MKIACISTSRVPSDTANSIQVMKACQALAQLGHSVHLLLPRWEPFVDRPAAWEDLAERYGLATSFPITWLPGSPRFKRNDFAWKAVQQAARLKADLVYTWTGQSAVFALLRRLPVVFEVHDLPTGNLGPLWYKYFLGLGGRKRLALITRALKAALEKRFGGIPAGDYVIAPNGVDLEQYADLADAPQARRALNLPEAETVLCSGHLYAGRGADLFLNLAQTFSRASFVWVGGRPEDARAFQQQARSAGLANVTFTGFISQQRLPCYQAAADILLMPYARSIAGSSGGNSADICSPMKMFDYLAAGRAILSSDLPVIHEVLNESNAAFALPEDVDSWADALEKLLDQPETRAHLGEKARQDVLAYSWRARAERILNRLV